MNYSFLNLGEEVLISSDVPLSVEEIWKVAEQKGLIVKLAHPARHQSELYQLDYIMKRFWIPYSLFTKK